MSTTNGEDYRPAGNRTMCVSRPDGQHKRDDSTKFDKQRSFRPRLHGRLRALVSWRSQHVKVVDLYFVERRVGFPQRQLER